MANLVERRDQRQYDDMMERVAADAARRAVAEGVPPAVAQTLRGLGLDTSDPIRMQRQMAWLADAASRSGDPESQRDREWTRQTRMRCERVHEAASAGIVKAGLAGIGGLLILGIIAWMKTPL